MVSLQVLQDNSPYLDIHEIFTVRIYLPHVISAKILHLLALFIHTLKYTDGIKNKENHVIPLLLPMDLVKWFHEESISRQKENKEEEKNNSKSHEYM